MRPPPIVWAAVVAVVVVAIAIIAGLLIGPGPGASCTPPSAVTSPSPCADASPRRP